jgi:protein-S-isoprenylcysteine O-methyltransferase Ste14
MGIIARRRRVIKAIGRDPIIIRLTHLSDAPHAFLESAFVLGGTALVVDVALNAVWPSVMSQHWAIPALRGSAALGWSGFILVNAGLCLCGMGVLGMQTSWRIGIDREQPGTLVTTGIFLRMRHPIYAGVLLVTSGMGCLTADLLSLAVAGAACVGIPLQARLEEEFLLARFGDPYGTYLARTRRFWPFFSA